MNITFQNVLDADGIGIAITGMSIVFAGLVLISLYISFMPKLLGKVEKEVARKQAAKIAKKEAAKPMSSPALTPSRSCDSEVEGLHHRLDFVHIPYTAACLVGGVEVFSHNTLVT